MKFCQKRTELHPVFFFFNHIKLTLKIIPLPSKMTDFLFIIFFVLSNFIYIENTSPSPLLHTFEKQPSVLPIALFTDHASN